MSTLTQQPQTDVHPRRLRRRIDLALLVLVAALGVALALSPSLRFMASRAKLKVLYLTGLRGPEVVRIDEPALREALAAEAGLTAPLDPGTTRIVIHKAVRRLELHQGDRLVKQYSVALGGEPEGPKRIKGDNRTPEGRYTIGTRLDRSQYHLFLGINYPNSEDARAGLEAGAIDRVTYERIAAAVEAGDVPDWETQLGGAIGIHGGGHVTDWTLGCIAVDDSAIEELWAATALGTPVEIRP